MVDLVQKAIEERTGKLVFDFTRAAESFARQREFERTGVIPQQLSAPRGRTGFDPTAAGTTAGAIPGRPGEFFATQREATEFFERERRVREASERAAKEKQERVLRLEGERRTATTEATRKASADRERAKLDAEKRSLEARQRDLEARKAEAVRLARSARFTGTIPRQVREFNRDVESFNVEVGSFSSRADAFNVQFATPLPGQITATKALPFAINIPGTVTEPGRQDIRATTIRETPEARRRAVAGGLAMTGTALLATGGVLGLAGAAGAGGLLGVGTFASRLGLGAAVGAVLPEAADPFLRETQIPKTIKPAVIPEAFDVPALVTPEEIKGFKPAEVEFGKPTKAGVEGAKAALGLVGFIAGERIAAKGLAQIIRPAVALKGAVTEAGKGAEVSLEIIPGKTVLGKAIIGKGKPVKAVTLLEDFPKQAIVVEDISVASRQAVTAGKERLSLLATGKPGKFGEAIQVKAPGLRVAKTPTTFPREPAEVLPPEVLKPLKTALEVKRFRGVTEVTGKPARAIEQFGFPKATTLEFGVKETPLGFRKGTLTVFESRLTAEVTGKVAKRPFKIGDPFVVTKGEPFVGKLTQDLRGQVVDAKGIKAVGIFDIKGEFKTLGKKPAKVAVVPSKLLFVEKPFGTKVQISKEFTGVKAKPLTPLSKHFDQPIPKSSKVIEVGTTGATTKALENISVGQQVVSAQKLAQQVTAGLASEVKVALKVAPRVVPIPRVKVAETALDIPGSATQLARGLPRRPIVTQIEEVETVTRVTPATRVGLGVGVIPALRVKALEIVSPAERTRAAERLRVPQKIVPIERLRVADIVRTGERIGVIGRVTPLEKIGFIQRFRLAERLRGIQPPRAVERIAITEIPKLRTPPLIPLPSLKLPKARLAVTPANEFGFILEVRRKGQFVPAFGKTVFTVKTARGLAQQLVGGTPLATFRLRRVKGKPIRLRGLPTFRPEQFRKPIVKGVKQFSSSLFIEKNKFRIDQPEEFKGITLKGLAAPRKKKRKTKRRKKK